MTVFKTFLKILAKNKWIVIMYSVILIFFTGFNLESQDHSFQYEASKPDLLIINHDKNAPLTKSFARYLEKNSNRITLKNNNIKDALFYRDVNYIIEIPTDFSKRFLSGDNPTIPVQSTHDYPATLAEQLIERYLKVATIYQRMGMSDVEIIKQVENTLIPKTEVEMTSHRDTDSLTKAASYYNFTNYSILAGCVYVICLILSSFQEEKIRKRTIISSMKEKTYNRNLLLANSLFALILWLFYVLLSFVLVGEIMFTLHGLCFILNSLLFTFCALSLAFLIGNLIHTKNALNGVVNVIALGTSFLCGAFVPMEWLPDFVLTIAHILPSYYYIYNNELIKEIEVFSPHALQPVLINALILFLFMIFFIVLTNYISRKRKD